MARSAKSKELNPAQDGFNPVRIDEAQQAAQELSALTTQLDANVRAVAAQVGYQLPADCTDPDLIQRDIGANMRRSVEACLEVGRGLAVLKAACGHGNFMARLDVLGIDHTVSKRFMQAAVKFSNGASTHLLKAAGNQTKLFEMLVLDDEQLEELELTGQTGDLHLDKIATMSVKELRAALRESRENYEAQGEVIRKKDEKLNAQEKQLHKLQKRVETASPDEEGAQLREEVNLFAFEAEATILGKLTPGFEALAAHAEENDCTHEEFMSGCLAQIERALIGLRNRFNVKAAPDGDEMPAWLRPGAEEAAAKAVAEAAAKAG
ncbi:MAG: hypothetical protein PHF75_09505, partial [Gallionella sp.]|nr:hypothetical protein [Gallionella sp.]